MPSMLITADQIRAARALINWSQTDLANRTGLAVPTIANIELGKQNPGKNTLEKIMDAFVFENIQFTHNGVSKTDGAVSSLSGKKGFEQLYSLIFQVANSVGGPIYAYSIDEHLLDHFLGDDFSILHKSRMEQLQKEIDFKILVKEGDKFFPSEKFASYRWIEAKHFSNIPFYVFGDYVAIIVSKDDPIILLMKDKNAAEFHRAKFLAQWKIAIALAKKKKAA